MTIANTETRLVPIDSLKPHPDNPRVGNVDVIAESIRANGFYGTVIVRDGTNVILAGTHRWKAAQAAGMTEIPVTFVKTDARGAKRILLADNRTSDLGAYDDAALADLLGSLGSLEGTGWDVNDLHDLSRILSAPDMSSLADKYGEITKDDPALWPVIRFRVPKRLADTWSDSLDRYEGDEVAFLEHLLALDEGR